MTIDPAPSGSEKKPQAKPKPVVKAAKKPAGMKPSKKAVPQDLNKSDEIRKVATKMKAAGQKVRPSLIVQELAKQGIKVAPAQVSIVLKRMGFKPLRKRKSKAGVEPKSKVPANAAKVTALGIDELLAVKKVVDALGGSDRAVEAIQVLKRLGG